MSPLRKRRVNAINHHAVLTTSLEPLDFLILQVPVDHSWTCGHILADAHWCFIISYYYQSYLSNNNNNNNYRKNTSINFTVYNLILAFVRTSISIFFFNFQFEWTYVLFL